jgi:heterotetrameric sarcosine oxidase gamma subunit
MTEPPVAIAALPRCTRLSVRADVAVAGPLGVALRVALGSTPCRANVAGERAALWLGPDEWLLVASDAEAASIMAEAAGVLAKHPASLIDVSHRTVAIAVSGPQAEPVLNAFCALDLDPRVFPAGTCTRTVFGKAEIGLWRVTADGFRIEVARSFAPYVLACLEEAAREFLA